MNKRPDNVFQFLEVERKLPAKVGLVTRKTAFREIYEPVTEESLRDQAHRCLACGNPYGLGRRFPAASSAPVNASWWIPAWT